MNRTTEQLKFKASAYCSQSEHCESEVREKLIHWGGESEDEIAEIIEFLKEEKYIDNQRYANFYARDKFRFNRWGKRKIALMLSSKKIERDTIEVALCEIDENEYEEVIREVITSKSKGLKAKNDYDRQNKLYNYAISKGFESRIITNVLRDMKE